MKRAVLFAAALTLAACHSEPSPPQGPVPANRSEAEVLQDFNERVDAYVKLRESQKDRLPALPKDATPQQIDLNQRELGRLIAAARPDSKQGSLFTPEMAALLRSRLTALFASAQGPAIKASIMDENPLKAELGVNQRYPDEVPLSTMPPEVLQALPKLPDSLEFRFVARNLIILDAPAHLVADYIPDVIPE